MRAALSSGFVVGKARVRRRRHHSPGPGFWDNACLQGHQKSAERALLFIGLPGAPVHWLPSPLAPPSPGPRARDKTFPLPRDVAVAFLELPCVGIHKRNLLKARVVLCSYNDPCSAPFSGASWLVRHHQSLPGPGSRHWLGISYARLRGSEYNVL
jgi:hypothetical protein